MNFATAALLFALAQPCPDCAQPTPLLRGEFLAGRHGTIEQPGSVEACTCYVHNPTAGYSGSGTCVDYDAGRGDGLVLTVAHILGGKNTFRLEFLDGTKCTGELLASDPEADIAVLVVKSATPLVFTTIADADPPEGTRVVKIAYAGGVKNVCRGPVTSMIGKARYFMQFRADSGDSGGGVFNADGEIVSVVSGVNIERNVYYCCGARVFPIRTLVLRCRQAWRANHSVPARPGGKSPGVPQPPGTPETLPQPKGDAPKQPPSALTGPPGPAGPQGPPGPAADVTALVLQISQLQASISALQGQVQALQNPATRVITRPKVTSAP